jgi:hypothetical protein
MSYIDLDARMSLGYHPNRWIGGEHELDRSRLMIRAAYQSLAAIGRMENRRVTHPTRHRITPSTRPGTTVALGRTERAFQEATCEPQ